MVSGEPRGVAGDQRSADGGVTNCDHTNLTVYVFSEYFPGALP